MDSLINDLNFDFSQLSKAAYILSEKALRRNGEILKNVASETGARIVLAQKAIAQPQLYPLFGEYLSGACASGPWEAQLAREYFPKDAHILTCAPAYSEQDIETLLPISNHLDFNSVSQWKQFRERCLDFQASHPEQALQFGLRINPEHSTGDNPLYDPCVAGSRLGATADQVKSLSEDELRGIEGLHFHTLCEQNSDDLETTVQAVEEKFGWLLQKPEIQYLNLGGGHWITKPFYDVEKLKQVIQHLQKTYQLEVWLEPGEAVAIHTGVLVAQVLDLIPSEGATNAVLNISATAHMPDVLEMPYRPDVMDVKGRMAKETGKHLYRLGGSTCLASDVIGEYAFEEPLSVGDHLIFDDMAHYTMVKTTMFNGVQHPDIFLLQEEGGLTKLKEFGFSDYLSQKV